MTPQYTVSRSLLGVSRSLLGAAIALTALASSHSPTWATEPCGDFGECKVLVEINSSDGDIGFHFLADGDGLISAQIRDPNRRRIFSDRASGPLAEQTLTETFVESAEPLCRAALAEEPDEVVVTLTQFLNRWTPGIYVFRGKDPDGETARGTTKLSFKLPAAPQDVAFDGSQVTWSAGDDLGECASKARLNQLVADGLLPKHPEDVRVASWEIVFEADDGSNLTHAVRVPGDIAVKAVSIPQEFLDALPNDTPAKVEVGAITKTDNATFTEEGDICVNETDGCADEE